VRVVGLGKLQQPHPSMPLATGGRSLLAAERVERQASVHLAEIVQGRHGPRSHIRMGNVDKTVLRRIALPGAIGAFVGATVLSGLSTSSARPWASAILFVLGFYVLFRYLRHRQVALKKGRPGVRFLAPLGAWWSALSTRQSSS